jgi:hypothetical protein
MTERIVVLGSYIHLFFRDSYSNWHRIRTALAEVGNVEKVA